MASQMVVPASKDTLFMRGFSTRHGMDEIVRFFADNGGQCTVEFFKTSDDSNKLYVALKFDSKDIAKDLLNKYDNTDVLGDRITISWFKDLRRARMKGNHRRNHWSPERYDRYSRYGHNTGNRWGNSRPFGTRGRKFDRSSSRSQSRSSSRSRSRSYSPSRKSRSHSHDSPAEKRRRSRTTSDHRRESHSRSKRSSRRERVSRERSVSSTRDPSHDESPRQPEPVEEEIVEKRTVARVSRDKSPSRISKVVRSTVTTVERSQLDGPSDDDDGESDEELDEYIHQALSADEMEKRTKNQDRHKSGNEKDHGREQVMKEPDTRGRVFKNELLADLESQEPEKSHEPSPRGRHFKDPEPVKDEERFYHNRQHYKRELSPPVLPPHLPEPPPQPSSRYSDQYRHQTDMQKTKARLLQSVTYRSLSPDERGDDFVVAGREKERGSPPAGDYPDSPPKLRERDTGYAYRNRDVRRSERHYDDVPREISPPALTRMRPMPGDPRDILSPPIHEPDLSPDPRMRSKRMYEDDAPLPERKIPRDRDMDEGRPVLRRDPYEEFMDMKKPRYMDDPQPTREIRRDFYEERTARLERHPGQPTPTSVRLPQGPDRDRDRSPYVDDRQGGSGPPSRAPPFNGSMAREMEKGALGLPQDKMSLVREKKEEIEKSYRQDCETFAAVTKMLICKDSVLEEKLQHSLRENLKDIGQRCIHELREYIEGLKTEDPMMH